MPKSKQEPTLHPRVIVKVQIPIVSTPGAEYDVMIYSKDHSIEYVQPMTRQEYIALKKAMKNKPKAFFYACGTCEQLVVEEPAPWQTW